ncbi:hypothetical protein, partial [Exercitatus varius]|uniref:hypothetical protein n=1 Tax=Exercitatus varius TaxID=67857 RepID=UPI00294B3213
KSQNISLSEAKSFLSKVMVYKEFAELVGMVRAGTAVKYGVKSDNFATQVPGEMNANSKLPIVNDTIGYQNTNIRFNGLNYPPTSNIVREQLKTELAFRESGILDDSGKLTVSAIRNSKLIPLSDGVIKNPAIVKHLTKDGSNISDWHKMTTESIKLSNGQSLQIHYYKNLKTGAIDYETKDFKVKGVVKP